MLESGTGTQLPLHQTESTETETETCQCTTERIAVMSAPRTPSGPESNITTSTLAFDQRFTTTAKGMLLLAEIVSVILI